MTEAQLREKVVKNVTMLKGIEEGSAEHKMIMNSCQPVVCSLLVNARIRCKCLPR